MSVCPSCGNTGLRPIEQGPAGATYTVLGRCTCQTPTITIPRVQYEALMASRVFVDRVANYDWSHYGARNGLKEQQKEAASVDAALRAAGFGASVYVCTKSACRDEHETKCFGDGHQVLVLRAQYEALLAVAKSLAIFRPKHPAIAALRTAGIETESARIREVEASRDAVTHELAKSVVDASTWQTRAEKAEAELAKDHDQWERDYIFEQRGAIEARDIKPSGDT